MRAEPLLELLRSRESALQSQGLELLWSTPPAFRQGLYQQVVDRGDWAVVIRILSGGSAVEAERLGWASYASMLLRVCAVREALGEPMPAALPPALERLRDSPRQEQPVWWQEIKAIAVKMLSARESSPPPDLLRLLWRGMDLRLSVDEMLTQLRLRRRQQLWMQDRCAWFRISRQILIPSDPEWLATERASEVQFPELQARWPALLAAPSAEAVGALREALEAAMAQAEDIALAEEQARIRERWMQLGARCEALYR